METKDKNHNLRIACTIVFFVGVKGQNSM